MIADFKTQETVSIAAEQSEPLVTVLDLELQYVGGGTETGVLF